MTHDSAHDHKTTANTNWGSYSDIGNGNGPAALKSRVDISGNVSIIEFEITDERVTIPVADGPDVDVVPRSPDVFELERAGERLTLEVGWRNAELTVVNGRRPTAVPEWLAEFSERLGLDEVTV